MMNNNLVSRTSLADEVAAALRQKILQGTFKINEKLPIEPELMKNFGVGRSTIREAIKTLVNSGLLRVQQGIGTFVENTSGVIEPLSQRLKRANVQDLDEVRQLLEMKIAEKAATNRTEEDIKRIKELLIRRKKAAMDGLLTECVEADIQFHIAIAEASQNDILADLYKSFAIHLKTWFLSIYHDTTEFEETYYLHEQLLKCISDSDPKKAWNCASKILERRVN